MGNMNWKVFIDLPFHLRTIPYITNAPSLNRHLTVPFHYMFLHSVRDFCHSQAKKTPGTNQEKTSLPSLFLQVTIDVRLLVNRKGKQVTCLQVTTNNKN